MDSLIALLPELWTCHGSRKVVKFFDVRKQHVICLNKAIVGYNWNGILLDNDVNSSYTNLTDTLHCFIDKYIPVRQVTITEGCPTFITPLIKSLCVKGISLCAKTSWIKLIFLVLKLVN